jgi:DNA polymerase-3 subunit beta
LARFFKHILREGGIHMKLTVQQPHLAHGLSLVSRAVATRSTLPVLANVLLATDEGRLRLSATNLELGISCWIPAQIAEEGALTVPARTLSDMVSVFPNEAIALNLKGSNTLTLHCGSSQAEIRGISADEFPPMPAPDSADGLVFKAAELKEMIQQVVFAASTDENRPVLQGVLIEMTDGEVTFAATDGFRISVRKMTLETPTSQPLRLIVPARALNELVRVLSDGEQTVTMLIPPGRGQVVFRQREIELVSQLIEGNFPDYKIIIPRAAKTHVVLSTAAFAKACRQAEIIAREGNNVVRLNIQPRADAPGLVEVSAQSEQTGATQVSLDANIDGPGLLIAFNVRFLREVLDVIKTPSFALEMNANNAPVTIRPIGDESFIHVLMPMHLG